ncbi:MAG: hypothetical protein GXP41_08285 [Chloroflexi bacterium]|nr:hypothetical protein [Chloroflexota bacterium]
MKLHGENLWQHRRGWMLVGLLVAFLATLSLGVLPGNGIVLWAAPASECTGSLPNSFTFQGGVYEGGLGDTSTPLPSAVVQLYGSGSSSGGPGIWFQTTTSATDGSYTLSTQVKCPYFNILEVDPTGYVSIGALAGSGGTVKNANWIQFGNAASGTYSGNNFFDVPAGGTATPTVTPSPTSTPGTPTVGPSPTASVTPSVTPTEPPATGLICVRAFDDRNGDGQWSANEPVLPGAEIAVKDTSFATLQSYTTTGNEPHCFAALPAGVQYNVTETDPVGYSSALNLFVVPLMADQVVAVDFPDVPQLFLPIVSR